MDAIKLIRLFSFCKIIANGGFVHAQSPLLRRDAQSIRTIDDTIQQLTDFDRNLQELPCNVPFRTITSQNVAAQLKSIFLLKSMFMIDAQDGNKIIDEFIPLIKHDVQLMKVCQSCASQNLSGYGCDVEDYGYATTHSGLVMFPVKYDEDSGSAQIINAEELQSWFHFRGVTKSPRDSFTWIYSPGIDTFEYALLTASLGYVSISPEKTGYGEASSLVPSDMDRKSLVTGTIPLYTYAKSFVETTSTGRTKLANKAQYMGASGGGYQAIACADGFKAYGIKPVKVLASAAPIKTRSWVPMGYLRSVNLNKTELEDALNVGLVTTAFSSTRPGVPNYNTGQSVLKPERIDSLLAMYTDLNAPSATFDPAAYAMYIQTKYPENLDGLFLSDNVTAFYFDALAKNDTDPCLNHPNLESVGMDKNCEALDVNDLTKVILEADYPIDLCHSNSDVLITIENIPDGSRLKFELDGASHSSSVINCNAKMFGSNGIEQPTLQAAKDPESSTSFKSKLFWTQIISLFCATIILM